MAALMDSLPRRQRADLSDLIEQLRGNRSQAQLARIAGIEPEAVRYFERCPAAPLSTAQSRENLSALVDTLAELNGLDRGKLALKVNGLAGGVA